ncbi:receptor-like protein EIX2 [Carya illinoinensis]|uniref:receptor-like protein EIX2 n=1 Tax=Carya illinoinensis TaxID=32201 RepID=UPI001C719DCF|nr:receptor-like protein EIX2 [Carya illinoinensis]
MRACYLQFLLLLGVLLSCNATKLGFSFDLRDSKVRCVEEERQALLQFKQHLVDHYHWLSSWSSDEDCCKWEGIKCSNKTGHVVMLDLQSDYWHYREPATTYLEGEISSSLLGLQYLTYLDLSYNSFSGKPFPNFLGSLTRLQYLNLSSTNIAGAIPQQFGNLSRLISLDLSWNYDLTEAHNLDWLIHLSSLTYLDMSSVNLSRVVNWPNKVMMLHSLTHLSLRDCSLSTLTTPQLLSINASTSSQLLFLDLSINYDLMEVHSLDWLIHLSSLTHLDMGWVNLSQNFQISNNRFTGPLPESIGNLSNLKTLAVYNSSLTGVIHEAHFSNLIKLKELYLGLNSLILRFGDDWVPPFQLDFISLSSCRLGSAFPKWLQSQKNYYWLDISDAGIFDIIPAWFWDFSFRLSYLYMSNNQLHGNLSDFSSARFNEFAFIDLSTNHFDGSIPHFLSNVSSLDLSNNRFSGPISFLCEHITPTLLESLNLSNNTLSGELPDCWTYIRDLIVLNLANNNFYGKIPDSMGSLVSVQFLHLSNNGLVGKIPTSLKKCSELITIDLGANNLSGTIPPWIGDSLPNLVILNLRSNQLYGTFPLSLCHLSYIQILDISLNKIEGTIPECISNLTAMSRTMDTMSSAIYAYNGSRSYEDYAFLVWKGRVFVFKNTLGLVKMIDLSNNKLHGEIPEGITNLTELIALNLSRNNLSGLITPKIGLLRNVESLDLSRNQFYGEIPMSISNLSFLNQLDLSANDLSGKIPTGTQIQSLDASAFLGNPKLCGSPLPNKCIDDLHPSFINTRGDKNHNVKENDNDGFITKGFYVAATLGFIGGFWGVSVYNHDFPPP